MTSCRKLPAQWPGGEPCAISQLLLTLGWNSTYNLDASLSPDLFIPLVECGKTRHHSHQPRPRRGEGGWGRFIFRSVVVVLSGLFAASGSIERDASCGSRLASHTCSAQIFRKVAGIRVREMNQGDEPGDEPGDLPKFRRGTLVVDPYSESTSTKSNYYRRKHTKAFSKSALREILKCTLHQTDL